MKTFGSIGGFFTRIFGWGGRSSGPERGPKAGDGAVVHHSSGEADFDGLSGDVPPPVKDANRDLPYPPKKSPIKLPFATIQYIGSVIGAVVTGVLTKLLGKLLALESIEPLGPPGGRAS